MSDTTDFRHLTNLSGQISLKVGLEVGPVEELRWTYESPEESEGNTHGYFHNVNSEYEYTSGSE